MDTRTIGLVLGTLLVLGSLTTVVHILRRRGSAAMDPTLLDAFWSRLLAWWLLFACMAGTFILGKFVTVVFFGVISFWALREFITLTPTRPADHRTLFWVFFVGTPFQYLLILLSNSWLLAHVGVSAYAIFSVAIPVYFALIVPFFIAISGDHTRFLERAAKIQTGLMICVYCLSYAPALLTMDPPGRSGDSALALTHGDRLRLLVLLILLVHLSEAFQHVWSRLPSRHYVATTIHSSRTWEGFICGTATTALCGSLLCWWATPFFHLWQAVLLSTAVSFMGMCGGLMMSAVKRDRGVSDYGTLVEGHSGILDRMDSLCFAAPVFYHMAYLFLIVK